MIKTAFSTVACPDWTLDRVASSAAEWGYAGVELRSFGEGGGPGCAFACEPGLTAAAKAQSIFHDAGVAIVGLASGVKFDAQVFPPVLGNLLPAAELSVEEGKSMVRLASGVGAEYLRVFAFEIPKRETRRSAIRRICERLYKVCDHARNRDLRVVIENGGSFAGAEDLVEIMDRVNWPLMGACYDLAAAQGAGDDVRKGVSMLGGRLVVARMRDQRNGAPCQLGEGELPVKDFTQAVAACAQEWGTEPWAVVTWDRAWLPDLASAESVLPRAAQLLTEWGIGSKDRPGVKLGRTPQSVAPAMLSA